MYSAAACGKGEREEKSKGGGRKIGPRAVKGRIEKRGGVSAAAI